MPDIFISYRRADSAAMCDRINEHLLKRFPEAAIFRDVDKMPKAVDFRKHIKSVIAECAVLLAIIGPRWLNDTDESGNRRLTLYDDPVRTEIELALKMGINVYPILVEGARMPPRQELPSSIQKLVDQAGGQIRYDPDFKDDIELVGKGLNVLVESIPIDQRPAARFARGELREVSEECWPDLVELRTQSDADILPPDQPEVTIYYPLDVAAGQQEHMLLYVHSRRSIDSVRSDAMQLLDSNEQLDHLRTRYSVQDTSQLKANTRLSLHFTGNEIAFDPPGIELVRVQSEQPDKDFNRVGVTFTVSRSLRGLTATGEIKVGREGQQLTTIHVPLLVSTSQDHRDSAAATAARIFRRVFISYSHQDEEIVRRTQAAYQALGIESLLVVDFIHAGESSERTVTRLIESADIFQLFWSHNAAASMNVEREWRYALSLGRDAFIRPVYWETPMPPPPPELAQLHFGLLRFP
ncbi:MAG TPA: toll/interleukin-1 receptor domain-containing protein [Ktedonobacterales bacterium]|jgi:hypothetical protein